MVVDIIIMHLFFFSSFFSFLGSENTKRERDNDDDEKGI